MYEKYTSQKGEELIIFNNKKSTIITEKNGQNVTVYSNESVLANVEKNQSIQSYLVGNFCQIHHKKVLSNVLYFKGKKVLVLDSLGVYPTNMQPDVLVITQSPKVNMERVLITLNPKEVVFDGSNYKSYAKLWEATCKKQKIPFQNTNEKGFYNY
jgi:competence protein ComEC